MANEVLTNGGGPVFERAEVVLTFCGEGWAKGPVFPADIRKAFDAVLASPYMSHLIQYKIRRAKIVLDLVDTRNLGKLGPDPRKFVAGNIWLISDEEIKNVARAALKARPPQNNEQVLYLAVVNQDPIPIVVEQLDASGYHQAFDQDGRTVSYGALLHITSSTVEHSFQFLPGVFSHELVETCTDPIPPSGFGVIPDGELCDIDQTVPVQLPGIPNEVTLAKYWSEVERDHVAPTSYSLRVTFGFGQSITTTGGVKTFLQGKSSMREFILDNINP